MAKHTLKPGYAYVCREQGFDYIDIPNEWWETEIVGKDVCDRCGEVGTRFIDGAECVVFVDDFDGAHYAQTKVMAWDS